jgi:hypothetical protein
VEKELLDKFDLSRILATIEERLETPNAQNDEVSVPQTGEAPYAEANGSSVDAVAIQLINEL